MTDKRDHIQAIRFALDDLDLRMDCAPDGDLNSELAIVGEAPGEREAHAGLPFVGGSGNHLWDVLRKEGIKRRDCYITNVAKRQVTFGVAGKKEPISSNELSHWKTVLMAELQRLPNLKYILALGNYAIRALIGESGITDFRGSVYNIPIGDRTVTVVCAFNPAHILREPKWELIFRFDLYKLGRVMAGNYPKHDITTHINPTYQQALRWIEDFKVLAAKKRPIAFDIELSGKQTACVGFAASEHEGYCINFRDETRNRYTIEEERHIRKAMQELFNVEGARFVAQNGSYDCSWLWYMDRIRVPSVYFDTMLAHHLLYPTWPHNLGFLTAQYTTHPYYKDEKESWKEGGGINTFWEYNVKDCCITLACMSKLHDELATKRMIDLFYNHVMRLQPHLVHMTVSGVLVDQSVKEQIVEEVGHDVEKLKQEFWNAVAEATGDPEYKPNPGSWQQLQELLFKRMQLVGRGFSTNKENRDRIRRNPRTSEVGRKVLNTLDAWAAENKFYGTYAQMSVDPDKRIRSEYKQTGTQKAPGRLSSASTSWDTGGNLQNQPERAQVMFIADEGYEFSYFDMAQIEARLVAWFANIASWKAQFESARLNPGTYDAHRALASEMFNVPYDEVPKEDRDGDGKPTIRFIAKRCRHGLNYRMMPARLSETLKVSLAEADRLWHIYHATTPEVQAWWDETIKEVKANKYLDTPFGRQWRLLQRLDDDVMDSVVAFRPQSTAGDHVASVIYKAHEDRDWPRYRNGRLAARCVLNVHDALIAINRPEDGDAVRTVLRRHAEAPIQISGEHLIVPADFKQSFTVQKDPVSGKYVSSDTGYHRWSHLKKVKVSA